MLLITIDEMPEEYVNEIRQIVNMPVIVEGDLDNTSHPLDQVEIMITYGFEVKKEILDQMPSLKWIQVFQTGVEHVPFDEVGNRGIVLTNVRGIYGSPMSEYVMSIVLYITRDIPRFIRNKKLRNYDRAELVDEAKGKTIGIFGTGVIGQEVAKKAQAFDMRVLGFNSNGRPVDDFDQTYSWDKKEDMLKESDFVVLLLPLTDKTHRFIGEKELALMHEDAYLINIGRGPLICENALIKSVERGEIKGAALDVFDEEPLPESSPLWDVENIMITPHLSGKSVRFFERCNLILADHYSAFKENKKMKFQVDLNRGY